MTSEQYWLDGQAPPSVRTCDKCRRTVVKGEPDPCLGPLPGVSHACCGHGMEYRAYVVIGGEPNEWGSGRLPGSKVLNGAAALEYFEKHSQLA